MQISNDYTPWPADLADVYRQLGYWRGQTLGDMLRESALLYADSIAVTDEVRDWTYRMLDQKADQLAAGFIGLGIQPGDKVVVQLPNVAEFFAVLFGLFRCGAVPILALPAHRWHELNYFCTFAEAKAYIAIDKHDGFSYLDLARKLRVETDLEHVIVVGEAEEFIALDDLYVEPVILPKLSASDIALMQLSGGTTNVPKLIPRTHDDYLYSVRASVDICQINASSVYLTVLPAAHNFPLSSPGTFGTIVAGGKIVLANSGAPEVAFELIERYRVTCCALVPPLVLAWLSAVANNIRDLSSLKILQVGGAKLNAEVAKRVAPAFGCCLQQVFGMAEGLVNYTRLDDTDERVIYTQGRPISNDDEIRIVDEDDTELAPGQAGQLLTRGPYTIRGYFRAAEHNARAFTHDGFYRTGDVVRLTADGYLIVEGRVKDQINRGGEKISAEELENQILAHPDVHDVAVVAMPDPYLDERTCAFIILRAPATHTPRTQSIRKFLRERGLADYKLPDRVETIEAFPQTSFGKVSKKALRKIIADKLNLAAVI